VPESLHTGAQGGLLFLLIRIYCCSAAQGCRLELQRPNLAQAVLTCRAKARVTRQGYCLVGEGGQVLVQVPGGEPQPACGRLCGRV
jgi:hypothetical protein